MDELKVLITGGSAGLGLALARELAARGAKLVLVARGAERLEAAVEAIREAGGEAHGVVADVADKRAIHRIAGEAAALIGPIDVLVNNASTLGPTPMPGLLELACEDLEAVLATNVLGPFRLAKRLAGPMALAGRGLIVAVSSDAAVSPYPGWGAYGASKAAADQLTRVLGAELAGRGVRTMVIDPGEMDTAMHAAAVPDADRSTLLDPAVVAARIAARIFEVMS